MKNILLLSFVSILFFSCGKEDEDCNCESILEENISELDLYCNGYSNNYPNYKIVDRTFGGTNCSDNGKITVSETVVRCENKVGTKRRRIECK